jgi:type IV secretion system protein VirB5
MESSIYQRARQEWDERYADLVLGKRNWQITAAGMMAITLVLAFGMVWVSTRSKFVPYVVEVDKLGYAPTAPQALNQAIPANSRTIASSALPRGLNSFSPRSNRLLSSPFDNAPHGALQSRPHGFPRRAAMHLKSGLILVVLASLLTGPLQFSFARAPADGPSSFATSAFSTAKNLSATTASQSTVGRSPQSVGTSRYRPERK